MTLPGDDEGFQRVAQFRLGQLAQPQADTQGFPASRSTRLR
ncbi:hypothetical protein [Streptomyces sp. NBC_00122]